MLLINREMPTCCEDCFAQNEYYNPRFDETEYSCGISGENLGTHSRRDWGEWHCDRPEWCPMKEQEAVEQVEVSNGSEKRIVEFIESYWTGGKYGSNYCWNDNHGELVRCKDCERHLECDYWIEKGDEWFCADGKRRGVDNVS